MGYTLEIDLGSGFTDYTAYLRDRYPVTRTRSVYDGDLMSTANTCSFALERNPALIMTLMGLKTAPVRIKKDGADYFTGYVRNSMKLRVGVLRADACQCECIDAWETLLKKTILNDIALTGQTVSSILNTLFLAAGFSAGQLTGLPTISSTITLFAVEGKKRTYREVIDKLLFEFGYAGSISASGNIQLYDLGPASISPAITLSTGSTGNIAEEYNADQVNVEVEAVDVSYYPTEVQAGAVIFNDTTGAVGALECSIPIVAGGYYPEGADATSVDFADYEVEDYEIIGVDPATVVHTWAASGHVVRQSYNPGPLKCQLKFYSDTGGVLIANRMNGTAYVKGAKHTISRENVAGSLLREGIDAEWINTDAQAKRLANIRADHFKYANLGYSFYSTLLTLNPGDYVTFNDSLITGISQTHRVVRVVDGSNPKQITVVTEPVSALVLNDVVKTTEAPSRPVAGLPASVAAANVTLSLSTTGAVRSRTNEMAPAQVAISTKYADGTNFAGYFKVAVSADAQVFVDSYTSASPEASKAYSIPATINISGTDYFVSIVRVRCYADSAMTVLKDERNIGIVADMSTAPAYFGAMSSPPSSGYVANDFYLDSSAPGSGGGVLRYWTGSTWAVATNALYWYADAVKKALPDMVAWCTENSQSQADVVAFETAIINSLTVRNAIIDYLATSKQVSTALCSDGATRRTEIDWDAARAIFRGDDKNNYIEIFKNYVRSMYKALATELTENGLVWRGAALEETGRLFYRDKYLRFSSGGRSMRLPRGEFPTGFKTGLSLKVSSGGVPSITTGGCEHWNGGDVVGIRKASELAFTSSFANYPAVGSWAYVAVKVSGFNFGAVIKPLSQNYPLWKVILICRDGTIRFFFNDDYHIYQVTTTNWTTWSAPVTVVTSAVKVCLNSAIETSDGKIALYYTVEDAPSIKTFTLRTSTDGVTWSSASSLWSTSLVSGAKIIQLKDGRFLLAYRPYGGGLVYRLSADGTSWGDPVTISAVESTVSTMSELIQGKDGTIYFFYTTNANALKYITTSDLQTWGSVVTAISSQCLTTGVSVSRLDDGSFHCFFIRDAYSQTRALMYTKSSDGTTWSTPAIFDSGTCGFSTSAVDNEGALRIIYSDSNGYPSLLSSDVGEVALFPATGALTGRPTDAVNIATTTGANFATLYNGGYYYRDSSGVYWRILGAIGRRASAGNANDFYVINLGNGSAENGTNNNGTWDRDGNGIQNCEMSWTLWPDQPISTDRRIDWTLPAAFVSAPTNYEAWPIDSNTGGSMYYLGLLLENGIFYATTATVLSIKSYSYRNAIPANGVAMAARAKGKY